MACGRCSELLLAEFVRLAAYGSSERDLRRKLLSPRLLRRLHLARTLAQQARQAAKLGVPRAMQPKDLEGLGTGRTGGVVHGVAAWHASPRDPYPSPRWGRGSGRSTRNRRGSPCHVASTRSVVSTVRTPSEASYYLASLQPACGGLQHARGRFAVRVIWAQPVGALLEFPALCNCATAHSFTIQGLLLADRRLTTTITIIMHASHEGMRTGLQELAKRPRQSATPPEMAKYAALLARGLPRRRQVPSALSPAAMSGCCSPGSLRDGRHTPPARSTGPATSVVPDCAPHGGDAPDPGRVSAGARGDGHTAAARSHWQARSSVRVLCRC